MKKNGSVNNWFHLGDQFAIAYVSLIEDPELLTGVLKVFLMAQAVESYLKGCYVFKFPDKDVTKFGHNKKKLYDALKSDAKFLPSILIPQRAFDLFNISHENRKDLEPRDQEIEHRYYSLLLAIKYGHELRYFGVGLNAVEGDMYGYAHHPLDRLYADFIAGVREYVQIRSHEHDSWRLLKQHNSYKRFSDKQKQFIEWVLVPTK